MKPQARQISPWRYLYSAFCLLSIILVFHARPSYAQYWAGTFGGAEIDWASSSQLTSDGGCIVAGRTESFGAGSSDLWVLKLDSSGNVEWQKTYGGAGFDFAYAISQTSDGGYIVAGETKSFGAGNSDFLVLKLNSSGTIQWQKTYGRGSVDQALAIQQISGGYVVAGRTWSSTGKVDAWVLKLDDAGNILWQKTYGGGNWDIAKFIQQTSDGGYIVAGDTKSFGAGAKDFWVLKLDSSGNVEWQKTYGGVGEDRARCVQQTGDGGYIVSGETKSFGAGDEDAWVLKLDSSGNVEWQKTYGGAGLDEAWSIQQISGGYVVCGATQSFGPGIDTWVFKLDSSGDVQWQKTYGTAGVDLAKSIQQTSDGGYMIAGDRQRSGGKRDFMVLKIKSDGSIDPACDFINDTGIAGVNSNASVANTATSATNSSASVGTPALTVANTGVVANFQCFATPEAWGASYGGSESDILFTVQGTDDGGCVVGGSTESFGAGIEDIWILRLGPSGNILWQKTYGGPRYDFVYFISQTSDGGYIAAAGTWSFGAAGKSDLWVLKLNSNGNIQWQKTYGGAGEERPRCIRQTSDGGYIVSGETLSFGAGGEDAWILKLDSTGNIQWQKTYGGANDDRAVSVQQTSDGGYIAAGWTDSFGGKRLGWVWKLDSSGNVQWQKTYGGSELDRLRIVQQTTEGGYVVVGWTFSFGVGGGDAWVLKLDADGNVEWQKTFGGAKWDAGRHIQQTSDGGYIVLGNAESFGPDEDLWVLKLDGDGNIQWQKTYGEVGNNKGRFVQQTSDGGYIAGGPTFGGGVRDSWVWKIKPDGSVNSACGFVEDTNVSAVDSIPVVADTSITAANSSATVATPAPTVTNTTVSPNIVCHSE